jgi:predicted nucleic-acid-binding protein
MQWRRNTLIADANVILRYLLNDHEVLSAQAAEILENHAVRIPIAVACEVVFVLQKVYKIEREKIRSILKEFVEENPIFVERIDLFLMALKKYQETKLDFVDCLLWAYAEIDQEVIFTFDQKLEKYIKGGLS